MKRRSMRRRNVARTVAKHARNFGPEADAVRAMPCLASGRAFVVGWMHGFGCMGQVAAAHVTARGMGGTKGGRFDLVPLCAAHHAESGEARTSQRAAFEERYGLDLRRLADEIAVSHEAPLGIRGLAQRWAAIESRKCPRCAGSGREADGNGGLAGECESPMCYRMRPPLDAYELDALFGWVRRRVSRARAAAEQKSLQQALHDLLARVLEVANDLGVDGSVAVALCKACWPEVEP